MSLLNLLYNKDDTDLIPEGSSLSETNGKGKRHESDSEPENSGSSVELGCGGDDKTIKLNEENGTIG